MFPYWLLFGMWVLGTLQVERRHAQPLRLAFFIAVGVVTTLMIGLRVDVGGDWGAYERTYQDISFLSLRDALSATDSGYAALNWLSAQANLGVVFVNLVCAIIFFAGFARLCWRQPNPWLAVLIGVPYLIIVVSMGYTRQAAAIGIICFAIADASERRLVRLVAWIGIAALLHKTAILMLPVALYPLFRRNLLLGAIGLALFVGIFSLVLRGSADALVTNYVQGNMDSQGADIRVGMNVLAGAIFLLLRNRIELPAFQKTFWTVCSVLSLLSPVALFAASASSGVDRLSLYLIPLQVVTYSRLPYLLSKDGQRGLSSIMIAIIGYSFAVEFVWLNYGQYASLWLPYKIAV